MHRARKDHTCISLKLFIDDDRNMCSKCFSYRQRQKGIGRRLVQGVVPKCEKPWFLDDLSSKYQRSLIKKKHFMQLLEKYNYKIADDNSTKEVESRLHSLNYRPN